MRRKENPKRTPGHIKRMRVGIALVFLVSGLLIACARMARVTENARRIGFTPPFVAMQSRFLWIDNRTVLVTTPQRCVLYDARGRGQRDISASEMIQALMRSGGRDGNHTIDDVLTASEMQQRVERGSGGLQIVAVDEPADPRLAFLGALRRPWDQGATVFYRLDRDRPPRRLYALPHRSERYQTLAEISPDDALIALVDRGALVVLPTAKSEP